jgi:hypothetical protein
MDVAGTDQPGNYNIVVSKQEAQALKDWIAVATETVGSTSEVQLVKLFLKPEQVGINALLAALNSLLLTIPNSKARELAQLVGGLADSGLTVEKDGGKVVLTMSGTG